MKKFFVAIAILAGIGIAGWGIYLTVFAARQDVQKQRRVVPVAVEIAPVRKSTIRDVGRFTGSLHPFSEFIAAPKIAGRLEKIFLQIGDRVTGGQPVAALEDGEYRQQVIQAEAELEVARANLQERRNILENARREYDRTTALRRKKIASESQLDAAESEFKTQEAKLKVATAQVAQKEAELNMAKVRLSYTQIGVPANRSDGYWLVGERFVDEGAMLAPNTPIVSILDIGTLIAVIHVIERDYSKIRKGLAATLTTDAVPQKQFPGIVARIAPLLKEKSREARVEIEVANPAQLLKPGMFVRVRIEFNQHVDATVVPTGAIVKRGGTPGVFLADLQRKTARFVPTTTGIVDGDRTEVIAPPLSGHVVNLGHHLLEDGSPIILPESGPNAGAAVADGVSVDGTAAPSKGGNAP